MVELKEPLLKKPTLEYLKEVGHIQEYDLYKHFETRWKNERGNLRGMESSYRSSLLDLFQNNQISFVCDLPIHNLPGLYCMACEVYLTEPTE